MSTRSPREQYEGQPSGCSAHGEGTQRHDGEVGGEPAAANGDLAQRTAGGGSKNRDCRLCSPKRIRGQTDHRDGDRIDVAKPDADRACHRPGRAECFPRRATKHDDSAEETANPTTDRKSNGLRNCTRRYCPPVCRKTIHATAKLTAVSAAASRAGATSTRSSGLSAATMPATRRNMTAEAIATPAASNRGEPSPAAA